MSKYFFWFFGFFGFLVFLVFWFFWFFGFGCMCWKQTILICSIKYGTDDGTAYSTRKTHSTNRMMEEKKSRPRIVIQSKEKRPNPTFVRNALLPMTTEQLLREWDNTKTMDDLGVRDGIVEAMRIKGIRPDTWLRNRNQSSGLYPDIDDPDFAARLSRKTEFSSLRSSSIREDTCATSRQSFETTPVQRLVARFLHPSTPYNGILLHHGVGVGKTCSAITVAETFLEVFPMNTVYIIVPQAIADGFKRTIFNVQSLVPTTKEEFRLTGERWRSPQCTGSTYLHLTGMAESTDLKEISEAVDSEIRRRYKIMGYLAFANFVEAEKRKIPATVTGQKRIDAEHELFMSLFSDHCLIIDEAHNLRDVYDEEDGDAKATTDLKEGKKLTPILKQIVRVAEGLRLMLMTATPMYNTAPEIVFLLNLLYLNDTKDDSKLLKVREIFEEDESRFAPGGEEKLQTLMKRYVSFMRGEHPNTFPLRLNPPDSITSDFVYPTVSMNLTEKTVKLTKQDTNILFHLPIVVQSLDTTSKMGEVMSRTLQAHAEKTEVEGGREVTNIDSYIQLGNFVYPDGSFGNTGFQSYFEEKKLPIAGQKTVQYIWKKKIPTIESVFGLDGGLQSHSPKIAKIVQSITKARGISFVYSRYRAAGALPIAIALELSGWCRVLANGSLAPLLKREFKKPPTNFYILLTSDESLSPDFKGLIQYATTFANDSERNGSKVKAILGSQIASEGLDLKCIREIHLLEGWFHLNRIEQIEGRGVRFCSHADLPPSQRNCLIYLHTLNVPTYETPDLYMYRLAIRKAQPIGRVTRLMKMSAWDCLLNHDAILLKDLPKRAIIDAQGRDLNEGGEYSLKDRAFSSFCDYTDECEFLCTAKPIVGENKSTFTEKDYRRRFLQKQELLADIFSDEVALPLQTIKDLVYEDIPWTIAEIGLRELLGTMKIKRKDGIVGTLLYQNNYIVFQPDLVTSRQIPLASRYGKAYGILPRSMVPTRSSILMLEAEPVERATGYVEEEDRDGIHDRMPKDLKQAPGKVPGKVPGKAPVQVPGQNENSILPKSLEETLEEFQTWKKEVDAILSTECGHLNLPNVHMKYETFYGWRYIFYHFRSLPEVKQVAYRWWIDNFTNPMNALLELTKRSRDTYTPEEKEYADLFPVELFQSPQIRGTFLYDAISQKLQIYCSTNLQPSPSICPSLLYKDIIQLVGPPVDQSADTETICGFLDKDLYTVSFKSVLKDGKKLVLTGAQCVGVSNLPYHVSRMKVIHTYLVDNPDIKSLILNDSEIPVNKEERKEFKRRFDVCYPKKPALVETTLPILTHIQQLSQKQICPYIEFLLRWMDLKRIRGKRWFLSVVDIARIKESSVLPKADKKPRGVKKAKTEKAVKAVKAVKPEKEKAVKPEKPKKAKTEKAKTEKTNA